MTFRQQLRQFIARFRVSPGVQLQHVQILNELDIFSRLTESQLWQLAGVLIPRSYSTGDTLIQQGDVGLGMFILTSGRVEVFREEDGVTRQLATLAAGQFVGEMALIDNQPRSASVRVIEDSDCLLLTREGFQGLSRQVPEFVWDIVPLLVERMRATMQQTDALATPSVATDRPKTPRVEPSPAPPTQVQNSAHETAVRVPQQKNNLENQAEEEEGLVTSVIQLFAASFMLFASLSILGVQEAIRVIGGEGSPSQKLNRQETVVSALSMASEGVMDPKSQDVLNSFRNALNALVSFFRL